MKALLPLLLPIFLFSQEPFPFDKIEQYQRMWDSVSSLRLPPLQEEKKWEPVEKVRLQLFKPGITYSIEISTDQASTPMTGPKYELFADADIYVITCRRISRIIQGLEFNLYRQAPKIKTAPLVIDSIEAIGYNSKMILTFKVIPTKEGKASFTTWLGYYKLDIIGLQASKPK